MSGFQMKCNTCMASFPNLDEIKEHYRTPWHCFNAKRRGQGLVPIPKEQFYKVLQPQPKANIPKTINSIAVNATKSDNENLTISNNDSKMEVETKKEDDEQEQWEDVDDDEDDTDQSIDPNLKAKLEPTVSIFDNHISQSAEESLQHMAVKFGFFLPDSEYLIDLEGMLEYLNEKVKVGQTCLYCHKRFRSYIACQHHMISKSHCKVAYEEDDDVEEFEDFYDFSIGEGDESEDEENDEDELQVTTTGELKLPKGKVVGHRQFKLYYKQYYKPEDTRAPVLAQQREELLRLQCKFDGGSKYSVEELQQLPEVDIMTSLVKYQKMVRKNQIAEQRGQLRQENLARKREYKSSIAKVRSSETTTDKIRDYHRRL